MEERTGRGRGLGLRPPRKAPNPSSSIWKPVRSCPARDPKQTCAEAFREKSNPHLDDDDSHRSPNSPYLAGTCPDMCPAKERAQRERLRDLSVFERLKGNPARTSPHLAVKKFCRTISTVDIQESDVRPPPVLQRTLKYLMNLVNSEEHPFEVVHDFVFDRTRSIRQDLSMQNIIDDQAISMYEEMVQVHYNIHALIVAWLIFEICHVKFHIVSHNRLVMCWGKSDLSSLCHLNIEQLMKCLLTLFKLYDLNRLSRSLHTNEAEFYSFFVLLHLGGKIQKMVSFWLLCVYIISFSTSMFALIRVHDHFTAVLFVQQGDSLSLWYRQLSLPILQSKKMHFARALIRYSQMGNYKRFFCSLEAEASDLQLRLVEPFLDEVVFL
ncbi:SAC3/GANP/Nin1/mts3/eIF-3 p25 family [Musa troglodytarum]|uniref:SAC3/GANP/Nin1/mts3/eIF-3 p25 family n=1 Tax=Musa troglodytarum TaxID=320322 RepID=A0A9E7KVT1_9LILI|nr:SAC3/GANP/Nin1/mts3/eIF-3 p25 family [Musa troglodytarum]